jgi:hypothetical protein
VTPYFLESDRPPSGPLSSGPALGPGAQEILELMEQEPYSEKRGIVEILHEVEPGMTRFYPRIQYAGTLNIWFASDLGVQSKGVPSVDGDGFAGISNSCTSSGADPAPLPTAVPLEHESGEDLAKLRFEYHRTDDRARANPSAYQSPAFVRQESSCQ